MNRRQLCARGERALAQLGVEHPLDIERLRSALSRQRGKPIDLVPTTDLTPRSAFGFTGSTDSFDVVMYEARLSGLHRDLVILHELAHMLLDHPAHAVDHSYRAPRIDEFQTISADTLAEVLGSRPPGRPRRRRRHVERSLYDDPLEWEAETMATILLSWMPSTAARRRSSPRGPFEEIMGNAGRR